MIETVEAALRRVLPAASEAEIVAAAWAAMGALGFFEPHREVRVTAPQGCQVRSKPNGPVVGTVMPQVLLLAGQAENTWTPVMLSCWIGSKMIALA
jgi:hypothetical protein